MKTYLLTDHDADDILLQRLIFTARAFVERQLGFGLISQVWKATFDSDIVPAAAVITLPRNPVISIDAVKYFDDADVLQTVATTDYRTDLISKPARIQFITLPDLQAVPNALQVDFTVGYGTTPNAVPYEIRQAIMYLVSEYYENRLATTTMKAEELPFSFHSLLDPFRIPAA